MPGDTFRTPRMLAPSPKLTLGPVLFNWSPEDWRDFYFRTADEAPLHVVSVGEVVCAKRLPFFAPYLPAVVERLSAAGQARLALPEVQKRFTSQYITPAPNTREEQQQMVRTALDTWARRFREWKIEPQ